MTTDPQPRVTTFESSLAKVLVVDDDAANVRLLERVLRSAGYQDIRSTTRSVEGLQLYAEAPPDVMLLDINMAGLDGFEVLRRLRSIEPDYAPVLVVTGDLQHETRLKALEAGARDHVTRPFNVPELLSRVRNVAEVRILQRLLRAEKALLAQRVAERTVELHDTRLEVIRRLGRAAEYRDNETGLHILRMSKMSRLIGEAVGMSDAQAELLLHASPMHDIGKIGIPDNILLKPGKLDATEWTTMRTHTTIGAEILGGHPSELLRTAAEIALSHHEKWDGSGYPHGLAGERIPLVGRVVALADVFDALTSKRPYKQAWPIDDAVAEIRRLKGSHFDPGVAEAFEAVLPEMVAIKTQYAEPEGE